MSHSLRSEADLYQVIKQDFINNGYDVKGEINSCDLVAVKNEEIVIVEIKTRFSLKLLYQATRRLKLSHKVYVATWKPLKFKAAKWAEMRSLCNRLMIGLILVNHDSNLVRYGHHPSSFELDKIQKRSLNKLIKEFSQRSGLRDKGGVTGEKIMTAYFENSIGVAALLEKHGQMSAAKLKELGAPEKVSSLLRNNHYNWFEKISRGIYDVKKASLKKLKKEYEDVYRHQKNKLGIGRATKL